MKGLIRKGLLTIVCSMAVGMATAQEKLETTLNADVVSQYMWRGNNWAVLLCSLRWAYHGRALASRHGAQWALPVRRI